MNRWSFQTAGALAALIEPQAPQLQALTIDAAVSVPPHGFAALLARPDCRLELLDAQLRCGWSEQAEHDDDDVIVRREPPFRALCDALSRNASLRRLRVAACKPNDAILLAGALAARSKPLRHLSVRGGDVGPAGAGPAKNRETERCTKAVLFVLRFRPLCCLSCCFFFKKTGVLPFRVAPAQVRALALSASALVTYIDFRYNQLDDAGFRALGIGLLGRSQSAVPR